VRKGKVKLTVKLSLQNFAYTALGISVLIPNLQTIFDALLFVHLSSPPQKKNCSVHSRRIFEKHFLQSVIILLLIKFRPVRDFKNCNIVVIDVWNAVDLNNNLS